MILNTHNNGKVLTKEYQRTLDTAFINRNRVSRQQEEWLDVPPSVGTGAYDDIARGWMDNPSWDGAEHRYTMNDVKIKEAKP